MSKHLRIIIRTYFFGSESAAKRGQEKTYQTLEYSDNTQSCDCPGWTFKKKTTAGGERTCKHTRLVQAGMARQVAIKVVEHSGPPRASETRPFNPEPEIDRAFSFEPA